MIRWELLVGAEILSRWPQLDLQSNWEESEPGSIRNIDQQPVLCPPPEVPVSKQILALRSAFVVKLSGSVARSQAAFLWSGELHHNPGSPMATPWAGTSPQAIVCPPPSPHGSKATALPGATTPQSPSSALVGSLLGLKNQVILRQWNWSQRGSSGRWLEALS